MENGNGWHLAYTDISTGPQEIAVTKKIADGNEREPSHFVLARARHLWNKIAELKGAGEEYPCNPRIVHIRDIGWP